MKQSFIDTLLASHRDASSCPPPDEVIRFFDKLVGTLFPEFSANRVENESALREMFNTLNSELKTILSQNRECIRSGEKEIEERFFSALPDIHSRLLMDIDAMYLGDPAANSRAEVIRTYPGFYAITAHRIAHEMVSLGVKLIPRIISEHAHRQTGIDIHPAATIGDHFCIDHGTGIVIGETTEIGSNVKIYQGVTLGALSVKKEDARKKRHPTIEDDVVLYAGASILGGKTVIGKGSTIGGNVWLTESVPEGSKIYYQAKMTNSDGETDTITFR
ncbi:serine acetyltransferase [Rhodohalobacter sp. SW132]|uniref:serine O-acetyltransferase n=1 Tax=Rhodohalobacter sp. SW132 TaxID=2293433 RepID=UPI000E24D129|nr:serine acetyltransferase [Rhodohalobacter sp. SW132]REL29196.1 serine acetyltransferase [Rhodohalobacter sp. SW132]